MDSLISMEVCSFVPESKSPFTKEATPMVPRIVPASKYKSTSRDERLVTRRKREVSENRCV